MHPNLTNSYNQEEQNPMPRAEEWMGLNGTAENESDAYGSSDEDVGRSKHFNNSNAENISDSSDDENESVLTEGLPQTTENLADDEKLKKAQTKLLTEEDNRKRLKQIKKSGVVYLSTIPPYMKPIKLRQILERFGEVGRIYLSPEDPKSYSLRVKAGGNRKKKFVEGWAEYLNKKQAKLAVDALNGHPLGGKKGSFYYDDIINMKYLPKFKWHDLTEQIALEAQERQEKLKAEIAQATRENRVFIDNVEKKERMDRLKRKSLADDESGAEPNHASQPSFKRQFDQKPVKRNHKKQATNSTKDLQDVLSKVF